MSNQLMPCPFCGGEAKRITLQDEENFGGDVIICQDCDACSRVVFGEKEGLVDSWNRRATQSAAGEPVAWRYVERTSEGYPYAPQFSAKRWQVTPEEYSEEPLYTAPPASAHGDEAVRFDSPEALAKALFDHGSVVTSRLVADRIFAAMRAQGEGEVV